MITFQSIANPTQTIQLPDGTPTPAGYQAMSAATVTGNPAKKALKGANAEIDLSDPKLRERFNQTREYNQQFAVGGIPPTLAAAFPDVTNFEDGETLAELEATAVKAVEKESRKNTFYVAIRVKGTYNGQEFSCLVLPGRGELPQPNEVVKLQLKRREANQSGLTLNVAA